MAAPCNLLWSPRVARKISECGIVVDRSSSHSLVEQVHKGIRERIFSGRIGVGTPVPSLRALADSLGVSVKVTTAAYARLVRDGWLRSEPRSGYIAVTPEMPLRSGRVLLVLSNEGFYPDYVAHRFQERCEAIGIQVSRVVVADPEEVPVSLDIALMDSFDFAVSFHFKRRVVDTLDESGVPFALVASDESCSSRCRNCVGVMKPDKDEDVAGEVVATCAELGVRSVELVDFQRVKRSYASEFANAGIKVCESIIEPERSTLWFEGIPRGVMHALLKRLSSRRPALPDLFFFLDDYVAKGALMAFALSGVRIPEDVKVITFANKGNGPIYARDLSRIEIDPLAMGDAVADFVIAWFKGRRGATPSMPPPVFIRGDTI